MPDLPSAPGAAGRQAGRPLAHPADKIEYARLLRGTGYGQVSAKTSNPRTSLHRYLASPAAARPASSRPAPVS